MKDESLIGRQVTIGGISINYFRGRVMITDFKVYEIDGKTVFVGFEKLGVRVVLMDMLKSEYTFKNIDLIKPYANILLVNGKFNFDDLLTSKQDTTIIESNDTTKSEPAKWSLINISIQDGIILYSDQMFNTTLVAEELNLTSPGIAWNIDTLLAELNFGMKSGGNANFTVLLDLKENNLHSTIKMNRLNVGPFTAPLKEYLNISELEGELTNDLHLFMNLNETTEIAISGEFDIDNFAMSDIRNQKICTIKNLSIGIDTLNIKNDLYRLNSININDPYVLVEMYDEGDNWSLLIPDAGLDSLTNDTSANEEHFNTYNVFALMAYYIRDIARTYTATDYVFDSLNVNRGKLQYNDFTLDETFSYSITDMNIRSKHIDSHADSINFDMSVLMNGESKGVAEITIDPQNFNNMVVNYDFYETNLAELTPYSAYYVSYPISKAVLNYSSRTTIHKGKLNSINKINIVGFKFGPKTQSQNAIDIPIKLAVAILKDVHGNINLEIPVEGSLNDPEFKIGKVIWKILKNLLVKVASAPFRLLADAFGGKEDELKEIQFNYLDTEIGKYQIKSLDPLSKILKQKEELNYMLIQLVDTVEEIDYYAASEAKKIYYAREIRNTEPEKIEFDEEVMSEINAISIKDSLFINWVDEIMSFKESYIPVQKKCRLLIGETIAKEAVLKLISLRQETIVKYFNEKGIAPGRLTFGTLNDLVKQEGGSNSYAIDRPRFIVQITTD